MARLLDGIRVIDLSSIWAAPLGTRWLADMGAEVIKVQDVPQLTPLVIRRLQRLREQEKEAAAGKPEEPGARSSPLQNPVMAEKGFTGYFLELEANKKAISLDFEKPRGRELLIELIKKGDILVDNHRPIVLERCGLTFEELEKIRPGIILLKVAAMGQTGPERNYSAFGATIDGLAGLAFHTGYHDVDEPVRSGINYADPIAGMYIGSALMLALIHRKKTGKGQAIDVSLREVIPLGELFMEYSMNARFFPRLGNREPGLAPSGVYPARGEDRWVSIAVRTDAEWAALCSLMGQPAWASDERFSDADSRWQNHDDLDRHLAAWTSDHDPMDLSARLQAAGIAAAPVLTPPEALKSDHLAARNWWQVVHQPDMGPYHYYGPGWRLPATPAEVRTPPAVYAQHNREVFQGLLGLSESEYQQLLTDQVSSESALPRLPEGL
jgi:crotonobetainyl-CoA:carnitine CoA-transferase CaiB-like acyl-CoA transferase